MSKYLNTKEDTEKFLDEGFASMREIKKFIIFIAMSNEYMTEDFDMCVTKYKKGLIEKEILKLGLPNGWQNMKNYYESKSWFFKYYRKK